MTPTFVRRARCTAALLAVAGIAALPASAHGQLLDRILKKAEEAKEVADRVGTAVVPISTEQEIEIGRGIAATVAGHYGVARDPALTRYVTLVGTALAAVDSRPDIAYRFAVLDTDEVNAFAAPGGYIFITRGALALMEDEAMLAGVLAHEIGHVNHRDVIAEIQSKARTALGIEEAAERVDITGEEYLQKAVETGASALFLGLSREDELEADRYGVTTAAAAGYDPEGLERFIEQLDEAPAEDLSLLSKTHPDAEDRLENIETAIDAIPSGQRGKVIAADRFRAHVALTGAAGR